MCPPPSVRDPMFVIAEDLVRAPGVEVGKSRAPAADSENFGGKISGGSTPGQPDESFPE